MCACVASDSVSIAIHVQPYSLIPAFKFERGHVQQQYDAVYRNILTDAAYNCIPRTSAFGPKEGLPLA